MRVENSFIPVRGVGEATERRLWQQGITHWDAFDPSVLGPTTGDRVLAYIEEAESRLDTRDATFFADTFPQQEHWRLFETFREGACSLDIETTGLDQRANEVTVVTTHHGSDTRTLIKDETLTRDSLREALAEADLLVSFNGKRFDVPFLETAFDLTIDIPHLDLLYPCRRIGLTGGLKAIEQRIGIDRGHDDISGRDAIRLWHAYERRGDDGALETLIEYNRDDTVNLERVAVEVSARLHETVFEAAVSNRQTRL